MSDDDLIIGRNRSPQIDPNDSQQLVVKLLPNFAGYSAVAIGAALAQTVAIFLASNEVQGNPKLTERLRRELLSSHVKAVRKILPLALQELQERKGRLMAMKSGMN